MEKDGESLIILFFIICLLVSLISKELNKKYGISIDDTLLGFPYTPLLILFGILMGYQHFLGNISYAVDLLMHIHPHAILSIFLPILIFESSFNARLPSLSTNFLQVLILIIPVVICSFLLIAIILKNVIGYQDEDLNWWHALTLGTILSATDPVAVVALLKELAAPVHINTIIEMESLFNDGSAMVFYTIFLKFTTGETLTISESLVLFFRLALGGVAFGSCCGICIIILLQFLHRGKSLFIHIIIGGCYSVFYVGEFILGVSGLLAVVSLGLMLNKFMKDYMTVEQVEAAEDIISYIQFINESLLFFFAGIIVGFEIGHQFVTNLHYEDWGYMFVLFIFIIIIRFIGILAIYPLLKRTGEGYTFKELILSVWGGLRGALSIALALSVYHNFEVLEGRAKILILFHTCGIAALTLVVNGTTAKNLVEEIKLIENVRVRNGFKANFFQQIKRVGIKALRTLRFEKVFSMTLWQGVENIVQFDQIDYESRYIKVWDSCLINTAKKKIEEQRALYRYQILRHMMKFLTDDQRDNYFYQGSYGVAEEAILQCCENPRSAIKIWDRCDRSFRIFKCLSKYKKTSGILKQIWSFFFFIILNDRFTLLDILQTVLKQAIKLQKVYDSYIIEDLSVMDELVDEINKIDDIVLDLKRQFPDELSKLSQQDAALKILRHQAHYLDAKLGNLIADKEGLIIRNNQFGQFIDIQSLIVPHKLESQKNLLVHTAFEGLLSQQQIQTIFQTRQYEIHKKGKEVVSKDDPLIIVVLMGQVEERLFIDEEDIITLEYGPGNVVGLANLIDRELNIQIVAVSEFVEIIQVDLNLYQDIHFRKFCYEKCLPELLRIYSDWPSIQNITTFDLINLAKESDIIIDQQFILPQYGGFIFQGQFNLSKKEFGQQSKYYQYQMIPSLNQQLMSEDKQTAVVLFKQQIIKKQAYRRHATYKSSKFAIQNNNENEIMYQQLGTRTENVNNTDDMKIQIEVMEG